MFMFHVKMILKQTAPHNKDGRLFACIWGILLMVAAIYIIMEKKYLTHLHIMTMAKELYLIECFMCGINSRCWYLMIFNCSVWVRYSYLFIVLESCLVEIVARLETLASRVFTIRFVMIFL